MVTEDTSGNQICWVYVLMYSLWWDRLLTLHEYMLFSFASTSAGESLISRSDDQHMPRRQNGAKCGNLHFCGSEAEGMGIDCERCDREINHTTHSC